MTGHPLQISLARAMRCSRAWPRSARGWKNMSLFLPRQAPNRCQSHVSDTGPGSLVMSTMDLLLQNRAWACNRVVPSSFAAQTKKCRTGASFGEGVMMIGYEPWRGGQEQLRDRTGT